MQNNVLELGTKQGKVWELAQRAKGFTRLYRFPDWMRKGYVEEFFRVDVAPSKPPPRKGSASPKRGSTHAKAKSRGLRTKSRG